MEKHFYDYIGYAESVKGFSPVTVKAYVGVLKRFRKFMKDKNPEKITAGDFENFAKRLSELGLSAASSNLNLVVVRSFMKYLAKKGMKVAFADAIELKKTSEKPIDLISDGDMRKLTGLKENFEGSGMGDFAFYRARAVFMTFLATGVRRHELINLPMSLDLEKQEIGIVGKGGKMRIVYFDDEACGAIRKYLKVAGGAAAGQEYLFFGSDKGNKISASMVRVILDDWCEACGVKKIHPHKLRHMFATNMVNNGVGLYHVQKFLGHTSPTTTQRYAHIHDSEMKNIYKNMPKKQIKS